ncbi:MAG: rhodanese-like domain-containing protein [Betaproteobacteria bacterium]|nr:rhodanese-like domain-containing protein [Betaproteobacteria bacterium]
MSVPVRILRQSIFAVALLATAGFAFADLDMAAPDAAAAVVAGKITLIDIRTPPEWKETGVAKGAQLLNMQHPQGAPGFTNALLEKVNGDRNAPIALICRTGNRTTQVQRYLQSVGFTQVYNVKEGMAGSAAGPGWIKRGLPVESCTSQC